MYFKQTVQGTQKQHQNLGRQTIFFLNKDQNNQNIVLINYSRIVWPI